MEESRVLKLFCILLISFCLFQYSYDVIKLPFKKAGFVDFAQLYQYGRILGEFKKDVNHANKDLVGILNTLYIDGLLDDGGGSFRGKLEIPYAWSSAPYPLFFYLSLRPFTYMNFFPAAILWLILSQIFLFLGVLSLVKIKKGRLLLWQMAGVIFIAANFYPIKDNNILGQVNILTFFLLAMTFFLFKKSRDAAAGVFLALAVISKWVPLILIIFFVLKREWKVVFSSALSLICLFAISIFRFGLPLHIVQITKTIPLDAKLAIAMLQNQSISGFFYRLFTQRITENIPGHTVDSYGFLLLSRGIIHSPYLAFLLTILSVIVLVGVSLWACGKKIKRGSLRFDLEFSLFIILMVLISGRSNISFFTVLLIPLISLFLYLGDDEKARLWVTLLFSISFVLTGMEYWLDGLSFSLRGWGVLLLSGRFYGLVLLYAACLSLLIRQKEIEGR